MGARPNNNQGSGCFTASDRYSGGRIEDRETGSKRLQITALRFIFPSLENRKKRVGDTEFESVTSTMSTSERSQEYAANHGANRDAAERLHQWLHQIAESGERSVASALANAIIETFGNDAVERLAEQLGTRR